MGPIYRRKLEHAHKYVEEKLPEPRRSGLLDPPAGATRFRRANIAVGARVCGSSSFTIRSKEISMNTYSPGRRSFLMSMTALGAASLPLVRSVSAAGAGARAGTKTVYDPAAKFDITVSDVEFRRNA